MNERVAIRVLYGVATGLAVFAGSLLADAGFGSGLHGGDISQAVTMGFVVGGIRLLFFGF